MGAFACVHGAQGGSEGGQELRWPDGTAFQDLPGQKSSVEELGEQRSIFGVCLGLTCQYYTFRRMV